MARYKTIDIRIWMDEKFLSLDEGTKLLFIYLLTSQHTTPIGTLSLPNHVIAAWLQNDIDTVSKRLDKLSQNGLIKVSGLGLIWIRNYLKYNPPANPKVAVGYCKFFEEMPECALQGDVAKAVISSCKSRGKEYLDAVENKLQIYISQPEESDHIETVSEQYRNQEQEQEQDIYIHNKQHTRVCNEGSAAEDSVCCVVEDKNCSEMEPEKKPLTSDELITTCKMFGIDLNKNARIEAIAQRKTITMKVLADCIEAWKQTGTGTGFLVVALEKAAKDPSTITPQAPVAHAAVTKDRAMNIASKLIVDGQFSANLGWKYSSVDVLACDLQKPACYKQFKPYLSRLGLIGGRQ